jgi:hypothetical protein
MANTNILASLFSQVIFSLVDSYKVPLSVRLNVSKVSIRMESKLQRHVLENGSSVVDSRIIIPAVLSVDVFVSTLDDLNIVNNLLLDRTNLYTITTKGLVFGSMMLESEKISQVPENLSSSPVQLSFKEVLVENTTPVIFKQSSDSSMIQQGMASLNTAEQNVTGLISAIKSSAASTISSLSQAL